MPIVTLILLGLTAGMYHVLPQITHKDIYFGVTVHPEFRQQAAGLRALRLYRIQVWAHSAIALAATVLAAQAGHEWLVAIGIGWQNIGASVAYLASRRIVQPYAAVPSTLREAEIGVTSRQGPPGGVAAQLGPFAILAAAAGYVAAHRDEIPARYAIHWDLAGHVNGWATNSTFDLFRPIVFGLVVCAVFGGLSYAVVYGSPSIVSGRWDVAQRRANLLIMLAGEYMCATMVAWVTVGLSRSGDPTGASGAHAGTLAIAAVGISVIVALTARSAKLQRSARSSAGTGGSTPPLGDRTMDSSWKWGVFYYEPSDPALFVSKRFGFGYTFNFANRLTWLLLAIFLSPALFFLFRLATAAHRSH